MSVFIASFAGSAMAACAARLSGPMPTSAEALMAGAFRQPLIVLVVASVIVIAVAPGELFPVCVEASVIVSAAQESPSPSQSVTPIPTVTVNPSSCSADSAGDLLIKLL